MKTFTTFLAEGGTVEFQGTIGDLKKKLRPGEYIKWNARGPQKDSTPCRVVLKDYEDEDYYAISADDDSGVDFGSIEKK